LGKNLKRRFFNLPPLKIYKWCFISLYFFKEKEEISIIILKNLFMKNICSSTKFVMCYLQPQFFPVTRSNNVVLYIGLLTHRIVMCFSMPIKIYRVSVLPTLNLFTSAVLPWKQISSNFRIMCLFFGSIHNLFCRIFILGNICKIFKLFLFSNIILWWNIKKILPTLIYLLCLKFLIWSRDQLI